MRLQLLNANFFSSLHAWLYFEGRNNTAPDNGTNQASGVYQENPQDDVNQIPRRFEAKVQDYERCQCLTASERDWEKLDWFVYFSSTILFFGAIIFAAVVCQSKPTPLELGTSITILCCAFVYFVFSLIRWRHCLKKIVCWCFFD